jgi:hypothetical protein
MSDTKEQLEHARRQFPPPEGLMESLRRRRDRKRRNQRITAGAVGITVFVAAIWIVTSGLSLDRSETALAPGGSGTGPAETGPTMTGPVIGQTGDPFSVGFNGLPPEGAKPSEPPQGELVLSKNGIHPWFAVNVYADGRLIWARQRKNFAEDGEVSSWIEQRLTPEGVELLRSGTVPLGGHFENPGEQLPVSAWEDPTLRPYVPSKYAAFVYGADQLLALLPEKAANLLRGAVRTGEVTTEDARALVEALTAAGFEESCCNGSGYVDAVVVSKGSTFGGFDFQGSAIEFASLLPDGTYAETGG